MLEAQGWAAKRDGVPLMSALPNSTGRVAVTQADYAEYLEQLVRLLREEIPANLVSLVLYGSVARGQASAESDLDLLVVLRDAPEAYYERLRPFVAVLRRLRRTPAAEQARACGLWGEPSFVILTQSEAAQSRLLYLDMTVEARVLLDEEGFFQARLRRTRQRLRQLGSRRVPTDRGWYWELQPGGKLGEAVYL
jgi:predicted nucleotidyltransferase